MSKATKAGAKPRARLVELWQGASGAKHASPIEIWVAVHYCPSESAWFASDATGEGSKLCREAAQNHFDSVCRQFEGKAVDWPKKLSLMLYEYKKHVGGKGSLRASGEGAALHSWWRRQGARAEDAKMFCALATGKTADAAPESICFEAKADEVALAGKVDLKSALSALAEARQSFLEEAERPKGLALVGNGERASKDPDIEARRLVDGYGFGSVSISDAIPREAQARMMAEARCGLDLIAEATGMSRVAMGLGGWALRIGTEQGGSSGVAYLAQKILELGAGTGGQALAHEWFHGLDAELARHLLSKPGHMASNSLVKYGGIKQKKQKKAEASSDASERCLGALRKLALAIGTSKDSSKSATGKQEKRVGAGEDWENLAMPGSEFHDYWLVQSSTLAMVPEKQKAIFKDKWERHAGEFMAARSSEQELSAFSALTAVYKEVRPGLRDENFKALGAALGQAKRPDPVIEKVLKKHAEKGASSFATRALKEDLLKKSKYMAEPCEMLARAFESSACYDFGAAELGCDPAMIRMVTDYGPAVARAPMGSARDAARKAFGEFFGEVLSCQGMDGMPRWLCGDKLASAAKLEEVGEKLAERRRQTAKPSEYVKEYPKQKTAPG